MPLTEIKAIDVTEYGATGNGTTNDTPAIQNAINAAVSLSWQSGIYYYSSPRLYFPPGKYKISDTLVLTDPQISLSIIGDDAVIVPDSSFNPENYALTTTSAYNLKIKGMHFVGFGKAVNINVLDVNLNTSQLSIEECSFMNSGIALRLFAQSGVTVISKCKFFNNTKAIHIAAGDKVDIKNCWIEAGTMSDIVVSETETITHPAQIDNYGVLDMHGCILVPHWPADATEPAWINNYVSVTVKDTRQGGEGGSFTLVNNFAPVAGDANSVIVKDSQCNAVYGNTSDYVQPAILRYVTKIPNLTIVRNNRGLIDCRLVEFSKAKWGNSHSTDPAAAAAATAAITGVINNSGTTTAAVVPDNVIVEIANNVRGVLYGGRTSFVPKELYSFVRNEESLWPDSRRSGELMQVADATVDSLDSSITFTFDYGSDSNKAYLINYSGRSSPGGSTVYSGGFTGVLKANGFWTDQVTQSLVLETVFNQIGDVNPSSWPTGHYTVEAYWEASDTPLMYDSNANRNFCIKITGRQGDANSGYDRIKVTPLDSL